MLVAVASSWSTTGSRQEVLQCQGFVFRYRSYEELGRWGMYWSPEGGGSMSRQPELNSERLDVSRQGREERTSREKVEKPGGQDE